jgi:anti-sigma regulatory factor (Ser/Thr protein kinase)
VNTSRSRGSGPARLTLAPELASVRAARVFVAKCCREAGLAGRQRDDVLLLASELVTNAILHGRSEVTVEVEVRRTTLRISVFDENSRHPAPVSEDPDALDGRGLALVEALAEQWGVEDRPHGKAVWFDVALG